MRRKPQPPSPSRVVSGQVALTGRGGLGGSGPPWPVPMPPPHVHRWSTHPSHTACVDCLMELADYLAKLEAIARKMAQDRRAYIPVADADGYVDDGYFDDCLWCQQKGGLAAPHAKDCPVAQAIELMGIQSLYS